MTGLATFLSELLLWRFVIGFSGAAQMTDKGISPTSRPRPARFHLRWFERVTIKIVSVIKRFFPVESPQIHLHKIPAAARKVPAASPQNPRSISAKSPQYLRGTPASFPRVNPGWMESRGETPLRGFLEVPFPGCRFHDEVAGFVPHP